MPEPPPGHASTRKLTHPANGAWGPEVEKCLKGLQYITCSNPKWHEPFFACIKAVLLYDDREDSEILEVIIITSVGGSSFLSFVLSGLLHGLLESPLAPHGCLRPHNQFVFKSGLARAPVPFAPPPPFHRALTNNASTGARSV